MQAKKLRCHNRGIDNCFKHFFAIGKRPDATELATTAVGLDQFCVAFNTTLDCIYGHFKRCGSPIHRELFDLATNDLQYRFREFVCDDGPLRQTYLKHGQCIHENVIGVDDAIPCLNNYLLAFEHLATPGEHRWHRTLCCAHIRKERCTDKLALTHCGDEAENSFRVFFDKMHFGFFSAVCPADTPYDPDSDLCREAFPNADHKPKANKSKSYVAKMLYNFFPFNYVPVAQRRYKNV